METSAALDSLVCSACEAAHDPATASHRCPDCGGVLSPEYDLSGPDVRERAADSRFEGVARYADVLPFDRGALVTLNEGATPLVPCPDLAAELGVEAVYLKDEGRNPTGTAADRQFAVAVTAAREHCAETVALPTTGDGGQSQAAYAARAGLRSQAFVPTRSTFVAKAMTNVHGGEMSVVQGRYGDARSAFAEADADADWFSLAPFATPYRHEGAKTLLYEVLEQLDWSAPDAVVHPVGHGHGIVGSHRAATELRDLGVITEAPALHAAQPEGCAPIVDAWRDDETDPVPPEVPDTLVGALEVPDPAGGALALDALRETGGHAAGPTDDEALEGAVAVAERGLEASATGGVAVAGARALAEDGRFQADDAVILVNPVAGTKENDVLRSHLMRKGI